MEDTINSWMAQNKDSVNDFCVKILEFQREFVKLEIGGYTILLTIPPIFHNASDSLDSDSFFLAVHSEEEGKEMDNTIKKVLSTLNEKLERVKTGNNYLSNVLDITIKVFRHYGCKPRPKPKEEAENSSRVTSSYLYKAAVEARLECQEAVTRADGKSIAEGRILPWCSVSVDRTLRTVELEMGIEGIVASDNVTKALGFCFNSPLEITLGFQPWLWLREEFSPESFDAVEVRVRGDHVGISAKRVPDEWEEWMKVAHGKMALVNTIHNHGPQVLVPNLVKEFFKKHRSRGIDDGLLDGSVQGEQSSNIFVRLLNFVGTHLSTLGTWCCNCKEKLPPLSRWWYCDAELCLFRHEELGVGASVLQELQNSELIELEISLAIAAASTSRRDVFEPFPTFLLSSREIRGRSGFFSTDMTRRTRSIESLDTTQNGVQMQFPQAVGSEKMLERPNKKMDVLRLLIQSFPSVADMQRCEDEYELRLLLSTSLQKHMKSKELCANECLQQEFFKDVWLPYNVLRFVLLTNRLSLHLLKNESKLAVPGSSYQFAVLYDAEREQYYEHLRATKGSFFAYHGSPAENWYSILRNGLRCLSQTPYMSKGMVHGRGIYFSGDISVSRMYSTASTSSEWKNGNLIFYSVIAVCEIFVDPDNYVTQVHVVPPKHEDDIAIRYLVVFIDEKSLSNSTSMNNLELHGHYNNVRANYLQKLGNRDLALKKQCWASFLKRKIGSQTLFS